MNAEDSTNVFVGDTSGTENYAAFFEDTAGEEETPTGGFLYVSDRKDEKIIRHLQVYKDSLDVKEGDVKIFWSSDGAKCGVAIWGRMRGIINMTNDREITMQLRTANSPAITDIEWLKGFDDYLDQDLFLEARGRYWRDMARQQDSNTQPNDENEAYPIETRFILYAKGPDNLFSVFEDEGATGYLYLFDSKQRQITRHLHIFDRSKNLNVEREDVQVLWSEDGNKCGVIIWDEMRGVIDRKKERPGRVWMETRNTPGINDAEWLRGFNLR